MKKLVVAIAAIVAGVFGYRYWRRRRVVPIEEIQARAGELAHHGRELAKSEADAAQEVVETAADAVKATGRRVATTVHRASSAEPNDKA
jgi:predicted negative regulator of RcsB-dependent stress response